MAKNTNHDIDVEISDLEKLAHYVFVYLIIVSIISIFSGYYILLHKSSEYITFTGISLIGFCGSAIAALTSSLDRYAMGFERNDGSKEPNAASGETFNKRMARWFFVRPFLGAIVAPVFIWGIEILIENPTKYIESTTNLAFTAFMGGLLAKSILDLIKGLFKNIFKT